MKLTSEEKSALTKGLNGETHTEEDKARIREILKKSDDGTLTKRDYFTFANLFFGIMEMIKNMFDE